MQYENILVETHGKVGLVRLNRPKALNALNDALIDELGHALLAFDSDRQIGCMVITGSEKAFAAGADIGAMAGYSYMDAFKGEYITRNWEKNSTDPQARDCSSFRFCFGWRLRVGDDV